MDLQRGEHDLMPVPGLTGGGGGIVVAITASTQDVDLAALLGNPSGAVHYMLFIDSGVVVGSSSTSTPALDASGLNAGSVGRWFVNGSAYGAGGDGGNGWAFSGGNGFDGGGGGGGGGSIVGLGGDGAFTGGDGADGTLDGGTGGQTLVAVSGDITGTPGLPGGDSVTLNHPVTVYVSGNIGGGGGGGDGASDVDSLDDGGDGGGLGEDGGNGSSEGATQGAAAGFAIRYSESGDATINLVGSGSVEGTVG